MVDELVMNQEVDGVRVLAHPNRTSMTCLAWCHTPLTTHAPKTAMAAIFRGFFIPRDTLAPNKGPKGPICGHMENT